MNVIIGCERSGIVRREFEARGHFAISVDLEPADDGEQAHHFQEDLLQVLAASPAGFWNLFIAHPPCTFLASSGARWSRDRGRFESAVAAVEFTKALWASDIDQIAIENPIGLLSTQWMPPTQIIQPWQFGHGEVKGTCLWLKGLRPLVPTSISHGREAKIHRMSPGPDRQRLRSQTYSGIARAMAEQWGEGL